MIGKGRDLPVELPAPLWSRAGQQGGAAHIELASRERLVVDVAEAYGHAQGVSDLDGRMEASTTMVCGQWYGVKVCVGGVRSGGMRRMAEVQSSLYGIPELGIPRSERSWEP